MLRTCQRKRRSYCCLMQDELDIAMVPKPPLGIRCLPPVTRDVTTKSRLYRGFILVFTFFIYASYHLSRKAISVVKNAWSCNQNSTERCCNQNSTESSSNATNCTGWKPFDGDHSKVYLGSLDTSFLIAYAVAMFFSGHLGDRMNLRYFLMIGMLGSGLFTAALGFAQFWNIHVLAYFVVMQLLGGIFQSTGWPSVVAIMANWFGKGNRGLIMGIWNSHTSVGNILGSLIAGYFVHHYWEWSFIVPGLIIGSLGILTALFLPTDPDEVQALPPNHHESSVENNPLINARKVSTASFTSTGSQSSKAVGICKALQIPGVLEYSGSLFFAKLVAYTFLYWLPFYIHSTLKVGGHFVDKTRAAYYSTFFDIGGIVGSIAVGYLSDILKVRGIACVLMTVLSIPALFFYELYGGDSEKMTIALSLICGFFVNGPYSLITTAVSADLGTHKSLEGSEKAKATVAAIIDGTGSIGAAVGPFLTGWIAGSDSETGWKHVFYMLIAASALSGLLLTRILLRDIRNLFKRCCKK
ncbi:glucose-6-phosphate exchanger SLC37A2-like [Oscarella lobularis]|uniref:glucose-6-phosphate exchanger SLC37A2-like n=1 Tax=Oscarella lobularis TaxID=121494 RepID=UPI003314093C